MPTRGSRRGSGIRMAVPSQPAALIPRKTTQALRSLRIGAEKFLLCNQQLRQARSESPGDGSAADEVAGLIQDVCGLLLDSSNSDLAAAVAVDMIQDDVIRTAVLQIYAVTRPAHQANQQQARDTVYSGDNGEPVDSLVPSTNEIIHSSLPFLMFAVLPLWQTASFRNPPPSPSRWPPTVISGFVRLLLRMQSFKPISQRLAAGVAEARELLRELATGEAESDAGGTVEGAAAVAAVVSPAAEAAAPTAAPEPASPWRRANAEELVDLLVSELTRSSRFVRAFVCFANQPDALLHDECDIRQHQSPRGGGGGGGDILVSYIADLAGALADSHILEHTARAAVTTLELELELLGATAAAGETGEAAGGAAGKAAGGGAAGETLQHDTVEDAIRGCIDLLDGLRKVYKFLTFKDRAGSVAGPAPFLPLLRQALSGPCVQYLVLAAAVAVLCAADGGPSYGMQPGLLRRLQCLATAADGEAAREQQQQQLSPVVHLLPERALGSLDFILAAAFHGDLFGPQTSRRGVLELVRRVGRLAVASARFWGGQQVEEEQQRFVMREDVVCTFATGALDSAMEILKRGCGSAAAGAGAARRWQEAAVDRWRLAADIVEHVDWRQDPKHVIMLAQHLRPQELTEADGGEKEGEGPVSLEPPPPDLEAALAGGLLPCLERLLRRAGRDPGGSGNEVHLLQALLQDQEFPLVQLLTHADPRQAVAFVVSLHKVMLRQSFIVEQFLKQEGRGGGSGGASSSSSSGVPNEHVAFAFTSALYCELLCEGSCKLRASAEWSLDVPSGGTGDSSAGGTTAPTATLRRLGLVMMAMLPLGLPAVSATLANMTQVPISGGAAGACIASETLGMLTVALQWIHILAAGGHTTAPRGPDAASGGGDGSNEVLAAGGGDDGSSARAAAGDEGWQSSVLRRTNPLHLLGVALRVEKRLRLTLLRYRAEAPDIPARLQLLAKCLCLVAEVLPSEVREAARRGAVVEASAMEAAARGAGSSSASGDGGSDPGGRRHERSRRRGAGAAPVAAADIAPATDPALPLSYWPPELVRSLAGDLRASGLDDRTAVELEVLAGRLVRWGAGEQGSEGSYTVAVAARLSTVEVGVLHALASPAEVAAVLRTCANPACVNLEGDSEAGLRLAACGRCGAAWYCCRGCQTAHWRTGHRAECGAGAAAAAAGGARARAATGLAEGD
ncbi:hypothetical protein PLESTB_000402100 [Pleodorina starrii]|uniref:phytol kinase n=1 Tax=Pleodorina starrii TaxID=330485 RepID=A0A9W6EZI4_9CHLO|nr:hypothetical protein PLESTM_001497500 [Pleodorina starrii]GLC50639.1 hypothetical protein PLESTB_000402100 [Pleodorina starrii]GLC75253.1 hypothetical protein PLESTF_001613700 [Pleodorina starrii]